MPECGSDQLQNFAARDNSRIMHAVGLTMAVKNPWTSIFEGAKWELGLADAHTVVVGRPAAPGNPQNTVAPAFSNVEVQCGQVPQADRVGTTEFTYRLQEFRGRGPLVCLNQGLNAYKDSYKMAAESIADLVTRIGSADSRYVALTLSGLKLTVNDSVNFYDRIAGGQFQFQVPFVPGVEPTAAPTFKEIKRIAGFMTTELSCEMFTDDKRVNGEAVGQNFKVLAGQEALDNFREEIGIKEDYNYLSAGGFSMGKDRVVGYTWFGPYQGAGFGLDPQPLRLNEIPEDGVITPEYLIPPEIATAASNGTVNSTNPAYVRADYEIMFLIIGPGAFKREVPPNATSLPGGFNFPNAIAPGQITFYVPKGECDGFQEYGQHYYKVQRAIRPQKPHYIVPILYKRCPDQSDLSYCSTSLLG
jgi:hypothetical protein